MSSTFRLAVGLEHAVHANALQLSSKTPTNRSTGSQVLGESILNDAVAITLFDSFCNLVRSGEAGFVPG